MTSEKNYNEASDARAVSNEHERVETTGEVWEVLNNGDVAAPTEATTLKTAAVVEISDVDALSDDEGTAAATHSSVK